MRAAHESEQARGRSCVVARPIAYHAARRAADAARARRHRARRKAGLVPRKVVVDEHALAAMLIETGRLTEGEALRPEAQGTALSVMIADIILRWRNTVTR